MPSEPKEPDGNALGETTHSLDWDQPLQTQDMSNLVMDGDTMTFPREVRETQSVPDSLILLRNRGKQLAFLFIPLLFASFSFLLILPLALIGQSYLPLKSLWFIASLLFVVAALYGTLLYYARSYNKVLWSLSIVVGFLLFLLVTCFVLFPPLASIFLLVAIVVALILLVRRYVYPVSEGYVDIVYAYGKYCRTLYPGPNFLLPWEKVQYHLNTRETHWICPEQRVHIARDYDLHLKASISYQVVPEDAYLAVLQINNWETSIRELFVTTLQTIVHDFSLADFMLWSQEIPQERPSVPSRAEEQREDEAKRTVSQESGWSKVNSRLFHCMQDRIAMWGVQINWAHIRDVTLTHHTPPMTDTDPIVDAQTVDARASVARTEAMASVSSQAQEAENTVHLQSSATMATPTHNGAIAATPLPKEDVLVNVYKEVQQGNISDPETIRLIASRFEAIASDLEASKNASFDAARAAHNLHERAGIFEEQQVALSGSGHDDATQPELHMHYPTEDNLTAGG